MLPRNFTKQQIMYCLQMTPLFKWILQSKNLKFLGFLIYFKRTKLFQRSTERPLQGRKEKGKVDSATEKLESKRNARILGCKECLKITVRIPFGKEKHLFPSAQQSIDISE